MSPERWAREIALRPRPLLLALDVDGTLAPIEEDPAAARVPAETLAVLTRLAEVDGLDLALVTGRDEAALERVAPIGGLWRLVEHGRVRLSPDGSGGAPPLSPEASAALAAFGAEAERRFVPRGARVERKASSRGVHVRGLAARDPAAADGILAEAEALAREHGLEPRRGRSVLEAEVEPGDKGRALRALHRELGAPSVVYAGDDLTDGPALAYARAEGGVALFVASPERPSPPVEVSEVLAGTAEVLRLLEALDAAWSTGARA